ncbi:hypothetical protein [Paenibacillus prosopidis]|uniref:Lipoprotein n=1 Tax=Paenibacillus prosopidis TaxID=630520 RepID=A0A368VNE4_9BACL|nr:hypothetical protein [Paenibacillus prosopidis]RCW42382.1 hypothetical protein DFP97_117106 [Paenibacillus prosopidis]
MKIISLMLSLILLSIGLFGCQQNSDGENQDNNISKPHEETTNRVTNQNYDIAGVISEVNNERNRVLLNLTKKAQENEEQMWITVGENTKISNENQESLSYEDLKPAVELKANLSDKCLEPNPRICFAEEIIIK